MPAGIALTLQGLPIILRTSLAAAEMAESIASGHRQGIRLEAFPQPHVLKGTVGVEVEEGPMFFHANELRAFWEADDTGADSETESMLAADEEGLEHLQMKVCGRPCCHRPSQTFVLGNGLRTHQPKRISRASQCPCMKGPPCVRITVSLCAPQRRHLLLQAKGGLGFFEPMSLPAAGTPKEQGANKRKSMDLVAQPSQDGELTQVHML